VLDRYPKTDRPGFPFQPHIATFCFPSGIQFHSDPQIPKAFSFILTNADGDRTYTTVFFFDELVPEHMQFLLKKPSKQGQSQVYTQKAIFITSHHSFLESFKTILAQIYRIQCSSQMPIPLERFIVNIMDEIPLPDKGSILI
jgi:hypothetical protein